MKLDDYDKMYDEFVIQTKLLDKRTYYSNFPEELKVFANNCLSKGWLLTHEAKKRDPKLSAIAQNESYIAFLNKIGHTGCDWLTQSWRIGGQAGGSCWDEGESHHYGISADDPPDVVFEPILGILKLDLRKSEYNALKELVRTETYSIDEYYGNYTDYKSEGIRLYDLYLKLKSWGYVE